MRDRLSMGMPFPYTVPYTFCTVAMLVLFARMLKKLFGHGSRIDPRSHGVMKLVARSAGQDERRKYGTKFAVIL